MLQVICFRCCLLGLVFVRLNDTMACGKRVLVQFLNISDIRQLIVVKTWPTFIST